MSWQACDVIDRLPYDACGALAFRVLSKLANVAANDGTRAFRYAGAIASELGVSKRSVQRAFKELESMRIILPGDQRHVQHIRADQRPKVYDINMLITAPAAVTVTFEEYETSGVTELSTDSHGVTNGVTTAVADKERRELLNTSTRNNHTAAVTPLDFAERYPGHSLMSTGICRRCGYTADQHELVNA